MSKKRIVVVFRADKNIGTGHLMRVKGLLPFLFDYSLYLVSDSLSDELKSLCNEYKEIVICPQKDLANNILNFMPSLVLIDHYFLDIELEKQLYHYTRVAVIDDLVNRKHMCHILFDQWVYRKPSDYAPLVPATCQLCLGREYNYIRPEFSSISKVKSTSLKPRVLINFGGADPVHGCLLTTKAILDGNLFEKYDFTIIAGVSNPDYEKIVSLVGEHKEITCMRHTSNVANVFAQTDIAIGACGGMFQERIMAGIPAINVEIADNQRGVCDFITKLHLGETLQVSELSDSEIVDKKLQLVLENKHTYETNCKNVYSPNGLENIAHKIIDLINNK